MSIIADNDGVVELARRVGKTCELDPLLIEVLVTVARLCLPLKSQVIKEKISVHATAREAHIIRVPLYAAHFAIVAFALHWGGTLLREEVVDQDAIVGLCCSEQVAPIRKLYFFAAFYLQGGALFQWVAKHVHYLYFVGIRDHDVEARWMERNCFKCLAGLTHVLDL